MRSGVRISPGAPNFLSDLGRAGAYASPGYLASRGQPRIPEDLAAHDWIALRENDEDVTLGRFTHVKDERTTTVRVKPVISSNDGDVER